MAKIISQTNGTMLFEEINPEKLDLLRADEGFMAVRLDEGNHELRFAYHTPGLKTGLLISLLSAACFFLTAFYHLVVKNSFTHAKLPPR